MEDTGFTSIPASFWFACDDDDVDADDADDDDAAKLVMINSSSWFVCSVKSSLCNYVTMRHC